VNWFLLWLALHIGAAVIGFGPAFAFPFIGFSAERDPQHAPFAVALMHLISTRLIVPVAGTMLISGIGLILTGHINPFQTPWLLAGLILYLAIMGLATGHQNPTAARILTLMREPAAGSPPPAEVGRLLERMKRVGMGMLATLVVIVVLMVVKPGGTTFT